VFRDRRSGVLIVDSTTGVARSLDFLRTWWRWSLVRPTSDGRLFVALAPEAPERSEPRERSDNEPQDFVQYEVVEVDLRTGRLESKSLVHESGLTWRAAERLSLSGRYWLVDRNAGRCETRPVLDLESRREIGPQLPRGARVWLSGDVLAWTEASGDTTWLLVARPGEEPKAVRGWRKSSVNLEPSPDSALLLVEVRASISGNSDAQRCPPPAEPLRTGGAPMGTVPETGILNPQRSTWIALPRWDREDTTPRTGGRTWAGPSTLARTGPGYLALEDIDRPGVIRDVIGHAP
jgi:hypothetical protein